MGTIVPSVSKVRPSPFAAVALCSAQALSISLLLPQDGAHLCAERLPSQHLQCREAWQAPGADPSCLQGHREVLAADDEARCATRRLIAPDAHTYHTATG